MISQRDIDVGYDAVESDYVIKWDEQIELLGINEQNRAKAEQPATDAKMAGAPPPETKEH